jgi:monothiol glutaredoxin
MMSDVTAMTDEQILEQIKSEVAAHPVFLYMKGTPDAPACGFSMRVVQILDHLGVEYGARNILEGCDIVTELYQDGELQKMVPA